MRVLYTTAAVSPQSGAYRMLIDMARGVSRYGYNPYFAFPHTEDDYPLLTDQERKQTVALPLPQLKRGKNPYLYSKYLVHNLISIGHLTEVLRERKVDVIHLNEIFDVYGAVAAKLARVPCVWHVRAELTPWPLMRFFLPRLVNKLADRIVVVSKSVARHEFEQQGIATSKISVIYDAGPDFELFSPQRDGSRIRPELGLSDDSSLIVMVGKLSERKGHEVLIRSVPTVLSQRARTYFLIVGGELSGSHHQQYAVRIRKLVTELGIDDHVIFSGYRADVPDIMAAADIIVHCSTYPDPFPGVVLQGMAAGKPVIASNIGGPTEQIEDGVTGVLIEPNNPAALTKAVLGLLQQPATRAQIGKAAAERVRSDFSRERFFSGLANLYEEILAT